MDLTRRTDLQLIALDRKETQLLAKPICIPGDIDIGDETIFALNPKPSRIHHERVGGAGRLPIRIDEQGHHPMIHAEDQPTSRTRAVKTHPFSRVDKFDLAVAKAPRSKEPLCCSGHESVRCVPCTCFS